ncbi:MAG: CNNM domain-containing protein, partial [Candidatus Omnitrophota bacterium]
MNILALLILLFILSIFSFFFSASETAIIGLSKIKLRHMIDKGIKKAYSIQHLLTKLDRFIAAILIGNDFVNIAISAIVTAIFVRWFGYHWGVVIATFSSTFFVLIMCEITPKI